MNSHRTTADLNEILFESRNKAYGAYAMRTRGDAWMMQATVIGLLLFVLATAAPAFFRWLNPSHPKEPRETPVEDWSWVVMTLPADKPAPPMRPPVKEAPRKTALPPVSTTRFVVPQPDPRANETILEQDSILHQPGLRNLKGTGAAWSEEQEDSVLLKPMKPKDDGNGRPSPKAFVPGVEREPQEVNLDDLKREIGYPALAKEGRIEGVVTLRVLMDERGEYSEHINISRQGTHLLLVKAVEQHIAKLRCVPGIQNGKPIPMWVNVSFSFKLRTSR